MPGVERYAVRSVVVHRRTPDAGVAEPTAARQPYLAACRQLLHHEPIVSAAHQSAGVDGHALFDVARDGELVSHDCPDCSICPGRRRAGVDADGNVVGVRVARINGHVDRSVTDRRRVRGCELNAHARNIGFCHRYQAGVGPSVAGAIEQVGAIPAWRWRVRHRAAGAVVAQRSVAKIGLPGYRQREQEQE